MEDIQIALLQITPRNSRDANLEKGINYCLHAASLGADIILFPEMWSNGYNLQGDIMHQAITLDDDFIKKFQKLAKELQVAIAITFLEKTSTLPRNSMCLFDMDGNLVLHYAKVHTCDFGDEIKLMAGDDFYVCDLKTKKGIIKVGSMICYDREFPESARILMLKGAELILVPNACPMEINRLSQLRARAYENMLAIATTNYPSSVPDCNGHSSMFDGIAYVDGVVGSRDTLIVLGSSDEEIVMGKLDVAALRKYREKEVHGNAYRHPQKYKKLIEQNIQYPFIRKDYRN